MRKKVSLKRSVGNRQKKRRVFIFSEGKNTEPLYFKSLELVAASSVIEVVCEARRGVPKSLLEYAEEKQKEISGRTYRRENGEQDKVWIAFDQDDHMEIPNVQQRCKKLGIGVAYSNPCFEVWLILHKEDYDKDEHRTKTQKYCEKVCDGYSLDTGKTPNYFSLIKNIEAAEERAERLFDRRQKDGGTAPLTTVYLLTKELRSCISK